MSVETMPARDAAIRVTATPADTNVYGDIFGGWLMAQMDLAASSVASLHAGGRAVTVVVEEMTFHRPVFVGDEVSVFAELKEVGKTSLKVAVESWRRDRHSGDAYMVTRADFTFVAIGPDRRPRPVKPLDRPGLEPRKENQ